MVVRLASVVALAWCVAAIAAVPVRLVPGVDDLVATPAGPLPRRCVHQVPSGSHVQELPTGELRVQNPDGSLRVLPACSQQGMPDTDAALLGSSPSVALASDLQFNGWVSSGVASSTAETGFNRMFSLVTVPNLPLRPPRSVMYMVGTQNLNWAPNAQSRPNSPFNVLGSVLQYPGGMGGWTVTVWFATIRSGAVYTTERDARPGGHYTTNVTRVGIETWRAGVRVLEGRQAAELTVTNPRLAEQPWAFAALLGYGIEQCDHFAPSTFVASKVQLGQDGRDAAPDWSLYQAHHKNCTTQGHVSMRGQAALLIGDKSVAGNDAPAPQSVEAVAAAAYGGRADVGQQW